jgi:sn-glycerol 3-phosphate transport system ATP-binding protein
VLVDERTDALGTGMPIHFALGEDDLHLFDNADGKRIEMRAEHRIPSLLNA